jgi:hypothetical protein
MGLAFPVAMMRSAGGKPPLTAPIFKGAIGSSTVNAILPAFAADANTEIWLFNPYRQTTSPATDTISSTPVLTWEGPYGLITNDATTTKLKCCWWRAKVGASAIASLAITANNAGAPRHGIIALQLPPEVTANAPSNFGLGSVDAGGDVTCVLTTPPLATSLVLYGSTVPGAGVLTGSANLTSLFVGDISGAVTMVYVGYDAPPAIDTAGTTSAGVASVGSMVEVKAA